MGFRRVICTLALTIIYAIGIPGASGQSKAEHDNDQCSQDHKRLEQIQSHLQDWAQLSRYEAENRTLPPPADAQPRVVFLGDSITDFWKLREYFPNKHYVNRGISAQTTAQMLVRFRSDVIALRPRVVVLLAGVNDVAGNTGPITNEGIEDNYVSMAELARANAIRVVFSSILPVSNEERGNEWSRKISRDRINILNAWLRKHAAAHSIGYIDYFNKMTDDHGMLRAELSEDGVHPNAAGYKIMAAAAEPIVERVLEPAPRNSKVKSKRK